MNIPTPPQRLDTDAFEIISRHAMETMTGPLADHTVHHARRALVDWTGLMLAGLREEPVRKVAKSLGSVEALSLFTDRSGDRPAFNNAALLLGMASHVLDFDDTDPVNLVHCSTTLFPALFAVSKGGQVSGSALLRAAVAGYEAESRLGETFGRPLTEAGWHVTGVLGHIGAALASALAVGPDAAVAREAMAISATASGGLIDAFGTMSKALQVGRTAADGSLAAMLAHDGFTGPVACLDGRGAFGKAYIHRAVADWSAIEDRWGSPYAIAGNSFKPHASCMITHPSIDAAAGLRRQLAEAGVAVEALERVRARVNRLVPRVAGISRPQTGLEGKFSAAYCIAVGLLYGRATPELFTAAMTSDAGLTALLSKIEIVVDESVGEQQSVIDATAVGRSFSQRTEMATGNPANPLSDAELSAKFTALAQPALRGRTADVLSELWAFDAVEDVGAWAARLAEEQT